MSTGYEMLDNPNVDWPQGGYPRRGGFTPSGTCILHTSEGGWTAGVTALTRLVRTRASYGCYHAACDWQDLAFYYPWEWEAWQDTETNPWAVGIAAACKTTDWAIMPADVWDGYLRNMAKLAANFVRYMRATYNIDPPRRRITGAEARAGIPGFCAHGDSGISRTDPGVDFDYATFFKYTDQELADGPAPASTQEDDEMPLILAKQPGKPDVWIGNVVTRTKIPNDQTLKDKLYLHRKGVFTLYDDGKIQEYDNLDAIGKADE